MADLGTKALEKDTFYRQTYEEFWMRTIRPVEPRTYGGGKRRRVKRCERAAQNDGEMRSTLPSISTINAAWSSESVSAHVDNQVHQERTCVTQVQVRQQVVDSTRFCQRLGDEHLHVHIASLKVVKSCSVKTNISGKAIFCSFFSDSLRFFFAFDLFFAICSANGVCCFFFSQESAHNSWSFLLATGSRHAHRNTTSATCPHHSSATYTPLVSLRGRANSGHQTIAVAPRENPRCGCA